MYVSIAILAPGELLLSCLAGFLTQPFRKAAFPSFRIVAWRLLSSSIWLYSSGHCSGFSPDSLLYDNRKLPYHQSGDKDRKLFKIRGILYYLN